MDDLISRKAAIDVVKHAWAKGLEPTQYLEELPSAQPEQKTGKWIEKEVCLTKQKEEIQVARCSNCKKWLTTPYFYSFNHYSFCPNCGVRMKGEQK